MAKYIIKVAYANNHGNLAWKIYGQARTPIGAWRVWKKAHNPIDLFPANGPRIKIGTAYVTRDDGKIFSSFDMGLIHRQNDAHLILS